jgi:glycosyltransferase involved in cell wall biosynthesis
MARKRLSIIIPAYNEEKRIGPTIDELACFFSRKRVPFEILVVMDGCTDATPAIVSGKRASWPQVRYREFREKHGKGGALLRGFREASGELVAYVDSDGSTPPEELYKLYRSIDGYDGVIGSRWLSGSVVTTRQPLARRLASRGFNLLTRSLLGLGFRDTQCPAKIFRRDVARAIAENVTVTDFAFDACALYEAKKKGFRIREVPIAWKDKPLSTLRMGRVIPRMFLTVLRARAGRK